MTGLPGDRSDFDYGLPKGRIAQEPLLRRDASRLLNVATDGTLTDRRFTELPDLLRPGDMCVANDTRVRNARLIGQRDDGGKAEALVLSRRDNGSYLCLVRPSRKLRVGARVRFSAALQGTLTATSGEHVAARIIDFTSSNGDVDAAIERVGQAPVPPYIHRQPDDSARYQTVFARGQPASAAAPTAGLHFTESVIAHLVQRGIGWATLRLDVGLATFAPMCEEDVAAHQMHDEAFVIPTETANAVNSARARGGRVIAIGTTVVRALETQVGRDGTVSGGSGRTSLFIRPGHEFRCADGLLTNFHQPRSTLLVLLAAFVGTQAWRDAYQHALDAEYRFLSFGDCMLCWRRPT